MSVDNFDGILSNLSLTDAKELRLELSKKIKNKRKLNTLSLTVYVQAEFRDSFEIAKAWAHEKEFTKKPSNWAFAKFAITNTIKIIIDEIERERIASLNSTEIPDDPQEPYVA